LYSSRGGTFKRWANRAHTQIAHKNVWQVLGQRPSRLAQGMAVREKTVTRRAARVKPYGMTRGHFASVIVETFKEAGERLLWLFGGRWRFFQVFVVPREDAVEAIQQVLFFVKAVRLAGVGNQFCFDAVAFESTVEFLALAGGIDGVGIPLKNERRRFHVL
jgi:hypothetical protein